MFVKNCPQCGKEQKYKSESGLKAAIKKNKVCKPCSLKGNTNTLGNKLSEEHRRNISINSKGKKKPPRSEDHKRKLSIANAGVPRSEETRRKMSIGKGGDGHLDKVWDMPRLARWTKAVKERDDYVCQRCYLDGIPGTGEIEAHHIVPKSLFPQYAYDLDNGQSLCKECHVIEHHKRPNDPWRAS